MKDQSDALTSSRQQAAKYLAIACLGFVPLTAIMGLMLPISSVAPGMAAAVFAGIAMLGSRMDAKLGHQVVALGVVGQSVAFVAALAGTNWQVDGHFMFLVSLAALVSLVQVKVILVATVAIVVHHLGFGIVMPAYVFPSLDLWTNVSRALFHAFMVVLLDAALILSIINRQKLDIANLKSLEEAGAQAREAAEAREDAETLQKTAQEQAVKAEEAQQDAEQALTDLSVAQEAREEADAQAREADKRSEDERARQMEEQERVVTELQAGLARLAAGNMSQQIEAPFPPSYEALRNDYNDTVTRLAASIGDMREQTEILRDQVAGISSSASDLATRTENQVAELEQATTEIKELNESVRSSATRADSTASTARSMQDNAAAGGEVVRRAVTAMSEIESSSQEIAKINAVIDGIAFQTNLLALNAGVEAARAGEAGRGFSVVASEVRALSQRATDAASDIGRLVSKSQGQVQRGVELVAEAGETLEQMVEEISNMTQSVEEIAEASQSQSNGLDRVTQAIGSLDVVAQNNAAMFEETSAACTALNDGMDTMSADLSRFQVDRYKAIAAE